MLLPKHDHICSIKGKENKNVTMKFFCCLREIYKGMHLLLPKQGYPQHQKVLRKKYNYQIL